jgi:hypothetical protein
MKHAVKQHVSENQFVDNRLYEECSSKGENYQKFV